MHNQIDHFTLGTHDLSYGRKSFESKTGLELPNGSKHDAMSTHNCVCQAGNESFLELISIDPEAPDPGRVRWFTLDDAATKTRIAERPRALCWVVNTSNLDEVVANSSIDLGEVVHFQRGDRTWRLTVPKDGSLPMGGLIPAFIEWSPGPHPSTGQQDVGVKLETIKLTHPRPDDLLQTLKALSVDHLVTIEKGEQALSFEISTPKGMQTLD